MSFIGVVFVRPKMYTISGSFGEVVAFLDGYISGIAKRDPYTQLVTEWSDFREWLSSQVQEEQSEIFKAFLTQHDNEQEALVHLHQLYDRFKAAYVAEV